MFPAQGRRIAVPPVGRPARRRKVFLIAAFAAGVLLTCGSSMADEAAAQATAEPPLSRKIDQLLQPKITFLVAAEAEDGALLRRLSLDLRGVVPNREELDSFAADTSPERWATWVEKFLQDPLCDENLVNFLDRTLMLRRSFTHVDRAAWISYLREQVAANTSLDALSHELLFQPWWTNEHRAAQRFYLDRMGDANLITRDVARIFLGRDLQCAQCHDHPLVKDFRQIDYHGLLAFVSAGSLSEATYKDAEGKDKKIQLYVERAAGDAPFESVFERGTMLRSGTRLPDSAEDFDDYLRPDQRYASEAPAGATAGVPLPPVHSRREQLANRLANRDNRAFVANWANRLWALVYGQGLVVPLDMVHPENPATNPELFEVLADGLLKSDLRVKPFLRQLVMTQAYRRGGVPPLLQFAETNDQQALAELRQQLTEHLAALGTQRDSLLEREAGTLISYEKAREVWLQVQADRTAVRAELDPVEAAMLDAKQKHQVALVALAAAQKKQSDNQHRMTLLDESATKLQEALTLSGGQDAELSQAIEVAKKRAEAARATVPELAKGINDAQSGADAAATVVQQTTAKVDTIAARLKPIRESLRAADLAMVSARADWADDLRALRGAKQDVAQLQHIVDWLDGVANAERIRRSNKQTDEQIATARAELEKTALALGPAKAALSTAEQALLAAKQELEKANQASQQQIAAIAQLDQAAAELGKAAKLVSVSDTLAAAGDSLKAETASRRTQLAALQPAIDAASTAVKTTSEKAAQRKGEIDALLAQQQQQTQNLSGLEQKFQTQQGELNAVRTDLEQKAAVIADDSTRQFSSAGLFSLSPEQLCWSTLRVTGVLDAYIRTEDAELEKQSPMSADADEAAKAKRRQQAVQQAIDKLRGNADHYASLYASGPDKTQDDFFASADQALYVANGGSVFSWAGPGNNNPTQAATALTDNAEVAKVLYWSYLCRRPSEEEVTLVVDQLSSAGDNRNGVIQEMAWSLLASAEFRFSR